MIESVWRERERGRGRGRLDCTSVAFNYRGPLLSKAVSAKGMKRVGKRGWWNAEQEEEEEDYDDEEEMVEEEQ